MPKAKTVRKSAPKTVSRKTKSQAAKAGGRKLKKPQYRSFRLSKKVRSTKPQPKGALGLLRESLRHLRQHKRLFLSLTLIYLLMTIILVKGFGNNLDIGELKSTIEAGLSGTAASVATGLSLFAIMLSSSGSNTNQVAGLYQMILIVITTLALIWALRQTYGDKLVSAKEAFYNGMYPLVPFLLVGLVVLLQLVPLLVGSWIFSTVITGGIAVTTAEQMMALILIVALVLLSFYMLTSSLFALYIVTLPDMTPMKALRSARSIVRYRRWTIMRRILALPVLLLVIGAIVMLPIIMWLTPIAEWTFFFLNMTVLAIVHSYMYSLYRQLL